MTIKKFIDKKWVYSYSRRMTYQKVRLYNYGRWKGFQDIFGCNQIYEIYRTINGDCSVYFSENDYKNFKRELAEKFSDKKFIIKTVGGLGRLIQNNFDEYLKFAKKLPQDASEYPNKRIINILEKFYKLENILSTNCWILFGDFEAALTNSFKEFMKKNGIAQDKINEIVLRLSEPRKMIPVDMEKSSLLKIALLSSKKQKEALNKHFQKFAYMPMYDIDYDKYDLKYFKGKLADINKKTAKTQIEKEIADIEKKYKVRKSNYSRIIKEFSKNKELFYISKFFADYSYLKDFKPYTRDNGGFYIKPLFLEVAKRTNLSLDQALSLNEEEIPKMLNEEIHLNPADLEVRMKNSAYLCEDGYITLVTNKKELEKLDRVLNPSEEIIELKGLGVSEGFAKGKVSVILSNNDFKKFKEGGILVTSATRPDFVPLMKKAIATVTDEGGILSHAAIISRELGKPCIVGTAKATRVLKDGDLVEVDADRGVVKILKHG